MPVITWELWLARDIVLDNPLPWQKSIENLTPGRKDYNSKDPYRPILIRKSEK